MSERRRINIEIIFAKFSKHFLPLHLIKLFYHIFERTEKLALTQVHKNSFEKKALQNIAVSVFKKVVQVLKI